jgi:hypothetical protein
MHPESVPPSSLAVISLLHWEFKVSGYIWLEKTDDLVACLNQTSIFCVIKFPDSAFPWATSSEELIMVLE